MLYCCGQVLTIARRNSLSRNNASPSSTYIEDKEND